MIGFIKINNLKTNNHETIHRRTNKRNASGLSGF